MLRFRNLLLKKNYAAFATEALPYSYGKLATEVHAAKINDIIDGKRISQIDLK